MVIQVKAHGVGPGALAAKKVKHDWNMDQIWGLRKKSVKSDSRGFDLSHWRYLLTCGILPYASHSI